MSTDKASVAAQDVAYVVRTILEEEDLNNSFNIRPYGYRYKTIELDTSDTLLFQFQTLKSAFPDLYDSDTYNLLLVLSEYLRDSFPKEFVNGISRMMAKDNIDRVVLWLSQLPDDEDFEDLKSRGVDIIAQHLPSETELKSNSLRHFVPLAEATIDHSLRVSYISNSLVTRLRKLFHLVLSEIAAPMYDEHYASGMVATKKLMEFEERVLRDLRTTLLEEDRGSVAVDVGCGTGRHSFLVASEFPEVYAFDLSPRMIAKAQEKKKNKRDTSIVFWTSDFEYERLTEEPRFSGRTDLVIASFGMASFVEDTAGMLRRFSQWLSAGRQNLALVL